MIPFLVDRNWYQRYWWDEGPGSVRAEDEPVSEAKAEDKKKRPTEDANGLAPLSEKLVAELTAHRTSALRNELAQRPATALGPRIERISQRIVRGMVSRTEMACKAKRIWRFLRRLPSEVCH
jgi:ParB family chromosome partitioning protein